MGGLSVGQKLGAGFAILVCLLLLQGYASISALATFSNALDRSAKLAGESSALVNGIRTSIAEMKTFGKMTQFAFAINDKSNQKTASDCLGCHVLPNPDTAQREFDAIVANIHSKLQTLNANGLSAAEKQPLDRLGLSAAEWSAVFREFLASASAHRFADAHSMSIERMEPILPRVLGETNEVEAISVRNLARSQAETAAVLRRRIVLLLGIEGAIILAMVFFGLRFIRRLASNLRTLGCAARSMASGDADAALRQLSAGGL